LAGIPVEDYCEAANVEPGLVRAAARRIAAAASVAVFEDLGIQMAPNSTLSSYLEKLVWLLTGNFAKEGALYAPSSLVNLAGAGLSGSGSSKTSPVAGARIISGLVPANVIAEEILTDHPDRYRAMLVESANPAHSLADSQRMRDALNALDFLVVIDVALTETGRLADYVLPAASQFEKWEATFFNFDFPDNVFHLRRPVLDPLPGTLPEAEIHSRLCEALGAVTEDDLAPLRAAAGEGRTAFAEAFFAATAARPELGRLAPVLLYRTLGPTLPNGAAPAAVLWGAAHKCALANPESVRRAGFSGEGLEAGEQLFDALVSSPSGVVFTVDSPEDSWRRVRTDDGKVHLAVPEMLDDLDRLGTPTGPDPLFPLVLSAGERRSFTANTIFRDPAWRKKDAGGALRMSPADADRIGVAAGDRVRITTKRGSVEAAVEVTDIMQPGHVSLPNGLGLDERAEDGQVVRTGAAPNDLTASEDRDWLAGTPWHKHVPARVEPVVN
jgi:anaerobic selenocysteine-containing dehydrogenase